MEIRLLLFLYKNNNYCESEPSGECRFMILAF